MSDFELKDAAHLALWWRCWLVRNSQLSRAQKAWKVEQDSAASVIIDHDEPGYFKYSTRSSQPASKVTNFGWFSLTLAFEAQFVPLLAAAMKKQRATQRKIIETPTKKRRRKDKRDSSRRISELSVSEPITKY